MSQHLCLRQHTDTSPADDSMLGQSSQHAPLPCVAFTHRWPDDWLLSRPLFLPTFPPCQAHPALVYNPRPAPCLTHCLTHPPASNSCGRADSDAASAHSPSATASCNLAGLLLSASASRHGRTAGGRQRQTHPTLSAQGAPIQADHTHVTCPLPPAARQGGQHIHPCMHACVHPSIAAPSSANTPPKHTLRIHESVHSSLLVPRQLPQRCDHVQLQVSGSIWPRTLLQQLGQRLALHTNMYGGGKSSKQHTQMW